MHKCLLNYILPLIPKWRKGKWTGGYAHVSYHLCKDFVVLNVVVLNTTHLMELKVIKLLPY